MTTVLFCMLLDPVLLLTQGRHGKSVNVCGPFRPPLVRVLCVWGHILTDM